MVNTKIKILFLYFVAYALLWFGYSSFIIPIYGYTGFEWLPNIVKALEGLLVIIFFALSLPQKVKRPSDFFVHVHFLLPIIPMLVLYAAADLPRSYMYFVISAFTVVCFVRKFKLPKIKKGLIHIKIFMLGLLIIAGVYISSIIMMGGLRYFNINLLKVYEYRHISAHNLPGIFGYLSPMVSVVLLPFLLILAVYQRKWLIACLALAGSVMVFALTNHKGPLFYPFIALGIYYITSFRQRSIQWLISGFILIILISLIPFYIINDETDEKSLPNIIVGSMTIRRGMFVPAHLNFCYYDFFSKHPQVIFAQSKLTFGLINYPYDLKPPRLIGYHYFNNEKTSANTGWLGSGYMNFGFAGMLFYGFLIGLLLSLIDTLSKNRELGISVAVIFTPLLGLFLSSDLPTVMLTHGLLLALLLIWSCRLKVKDNLSSVPGRSVIQPQRKKSTVRIFRWSRTTK